MRIRPLTAAFCVTLLVAMVGCGSETGSGEDHSSTNPSAPFHATSGQVRAFVADHLRNDEEDGGQVRDAICTRGSCTVVYDAGEILGIDSERELLDQQRGIFRRLFSGRAIRSVLLVAWGKVTTVGGKEQAAPILRVRCTRSAADQIDWGNVDVDGIKALCDWTPMVKL